MSDATFEGKIQQPKLKGRTLYIEHAGEPPIVYYLQSGKDGEEGRP